MTARQVTRHLWQVFDGERRLGAVLRVNGDRETVWVSQPEGAPRDAWRRWPTFDHAQAALSPMPEAPPEEAPQPAPPVFADRLADLEVD